MSGADRDPSVRVPEEPEDRRPLGTGEDAQPATDGLAVDPYADDMPLGLRRTGTSRLVVAGIIVVAGICLLILAIVYASGMLSHAPAPMPTLNLSL